MKNENFTIVTPAAKTDTCPYCDYWFEKPPTRKKICPECKKHIFVRFGKLYTEEEKEIFDWLENYVVKEELRITREEFNEARQKLSQEFGFVAPVNDTKWRLLNLKNTPYRSFRDRKNIYLLMAAILEEEGKNTDEVLASAHFMEKREGEEQNEATAKRIKKELLEAKRLSKTMGSKVLVNVLTCNDEHVCNECKKLSKEIFTIEDFLKFMPIPHQCTNTSCRCYIGIKFA